MNQDTRDTYLLIHEVLHSNVRSIEIDSKIYPVEINGRANQPSIRYGNKLFLRQGPDPLSLLGKKVIEGHTVTRIIRTGGKWGFIINTHIADPGNGE